MLILLLFLFSNSKLFLLSSAQTNPRIKTNFDFGWKFNLGETGESCDSDAFPINMNGTQCYGLSQVNGVTTQDECRNSCCGNEACQTWQWCPVGATTCSPAGSCWVGARTNCTNSGKDWVSQGRDATTTCSVSFCQPNFNDASWRNLDLPHDFVIEGTFSSSAEQSHGYLPKGVGWYRKHFTLPTTYEGKSIWIYFDGIYRDSTTYLNGVLLGNHPSGYTSFWYDITGIPGLTLNYGTGDNVLAVRADSTHDEGWWYEGGGIYRHTFLEAANPVHITPWGHYTPSAVTGTISQLEAQPGLDWAYAYVASSALFQIQSTVTNQGSSTTSVRLVTQIIDPTTGQQVGTNTGSFVNINAKANVTQSQNISVSSITLWDYEAPKLYQVRTQVYANDGTTLLDQVTTTTGVRKFVFDANNGLFLNDRNVKVRGLCNHQDFAGTGTAVPDRVNMFRIAKLKEMGGNGWRMSHNPPNSELLDFADQMGILVWDENRNFDDTPQYRDDVARMVQRDRNHPSIFLWSLCNENGCMENANDAYGLQVAQTLTSIIRANDPIYTRFVTAAWNAGSTDLLQGWGPKVLDVQGINYNYNNLDIYHTNYPKIPIISSETASCTCARGIYLTNDTAAHKDVYSADGCAQTWWTADATRAFVEGGFAWTGFDYKGETTPYSWPEVNSNFGIIDLAGFPKDTFYYYQSWWTSQPVLHLFPHWNTPPAQSGLSTSGCSSGDKDQLWNFTGSGTSQGQLKLANTNLCVAGSCSDSTNGCSHLPLATCDNSRGQLFTYGSDKSFKNAENGACLDLWAGAGPNVGVYGCNGGANQHWELNTSSGVIRSDVTSPANLCLTGLQGVSVWAYTNAATVELFLNSVSQGKRSVPSLGHVQWDVQYSAGTLSAVSYDSSGNTIAKTDITTTGAPSSLILQNEYPTDGKIVANGQDVGLISVTALDDQGRIVPTASNVITFTITSGPGTIYGVGNGDPACHEADKGNTRSLFNGFARVIVKGTTTPGTITLQASSPGLKSATIQLMSS